MTMFRQNLLMLLFLLPVTLSCCKQQETTPITEVATPQDTTTINVQELMLDNQTEFEENINLLMKLIKEKEDELKKAKIELKQKSAEITEKQQQLTKIETELKLFRNVTYLILVVGLALVIIGLILIFLRRKSANSGTS